MAKTYRSLIHNLNWVLTCLLSLLGFSNCELDTPVEYGSPYATYKLSGIVSNEKGIPIPHIKIEAGEAHRYMQAAESSQIDGSYLIEISSTGRVDTIYLTVTDVDGKTNGYYEKDTIQVFIHSDDYYDKGKGNWNKGAAAKTVNIQLKEKL